MRRIRSSGVIAVALALLVAGVSAASPQRAAASVPPFSTVASLEDGPSEMAAKARSDGAIPAAGWEQSFLQQQSLRAPRYSEQQRQEHLQAAQAAHAYAAQYVKQHQMTQQKQQQQSPKPQQRSAGPAATKPKFAASTYELIARAQQVSREAALRRKQESATAAGQAAPQQQQKPSDAFHFADAGAFIEEGVHLKHSTAGKGQGRGRARGRARSRTHAHAKAKARAGGPFEKQEWTYSDTAAPPSWLQASTDGLQGLPTTKPPPVPRMPPPPPPQPTPTWMSPFDEHQTPVFPQSTTPAPFYGMGPAPPGPPANYLPLDAFLSPAPESEAGAGGGAEGAPAEF